MRHTATKARAALVVVLMAMLMSSVAFGEDHGQCYGAYLESGLTEQQMTFDQFHRLYDATLCAPNGDGFEASREGRVLGETR